MLFTLLVCVPPAKTADLTCPDAQLFSGKLISDICWACVFPIRLAGMTVWEGDAPDGASDQVVCNCPDNNGVADLGIVIGMWEPARLVELVRAPGCSPSLGGVTLPVGSKRLIGTHGQSERDSSDLSFFNYHWYAFPLLVLLDLFYDAACVDGLLDFDLLYLSELDPTWR